MDPNQFLDSYAHLELERQRQRVFSSLFTGEIEPQQLHQYVLLDELGRGGMGVVLAAYDRKLGRKVAIKLMKTRAHRDSRARFEREARSMAKLDHPNVVRVYEIGEFDDTIFIVMEYVEGVTLRDWLGAEPRGWGEVLAIFTAAGRGLAAVHDIGLIHRDFKPDNVMVTPDGRAVIMDFGLASGTPNTSWEGAVSEPEEVKATTLTNTRDIMGTPAYMAPEQWAGGRVTVKADQFSFCVGLWEALHGQRPFEVAHHDSSAQTHAESRPSPSRAARVPRWLRRVLSRGLEAEPDRRHASMHALLDMLAFNPVMWSRRWASVVVAAGVLLLLAVMFAVEFNQVRTDVETKVKFAKLIEEATDVSTGNLAYLGHAHELIAAIRVTGSFGPDAAEDYGPDFASPPEAVTNALFDAMNVEEMWKLRLELRGHTGMIRDIDWSPDHGALATASEDQTAMIWDTTSGDHLHTLPHSAPVHHVAFSSDGERLVTASKDGVVSIWSVPSGQFVRTFDGCTGRPVFTGTGILVMARVDGTLQFWQRASDRVWQSPEAPDAAVLALAVTSNGDLVATAKANGFIELWDVATGRRLRALPRHVGGELVSIVFSRDGELLASSDIESKVRVWRLDTDTGSLTIDMQGRIIHSMEFDASSKHLLLGNDRVTEIWDVTSGTRIRSMKGWTSSASYLNDDEQVLATGYWSSTIWSVEQGPPLHALVCTTPDQGEHKGQSLSAVSSDSRMIAVGTREGVVDLWSRSGALRTEEMTLRAPQAQPRPDFAMFPQGGDRLLTVDGRTMRTWDVATGAPLGEHYFENEITGLSVGPAAQSWVTTSSCGLREIRGPHDKSRITFSGGCEREEEVVELWNAWSGVYLDDISDLPFHTIVAVAEDRVAVTDYECGTVSLYDASTHGLQHTLPSVGDRTLAFMPDGRTLLVPSKGSSAWTWDSDTGERLIRWNAAAAESTAFSPDGQKAALSGIGGSLNIRDTATGRVLNRRSGALTAGFSADNRELLTLTYDHTIRREPVDPLLAACDQFDNTVQRLHVAFTCASARRYAHKGFAHPSELDLDSRHRRSEVASWLALTLFQVWLALLLATTYAATVRSWAGSSKSRRLLAAAALLGPCLFVSLAHRHIATESPTTHLMFLLELAGSTLAVALAGLALLELIRRSPRRWWLWLSLGLTTATALACTLAPQSLAAALDAWGAWVPPTLELVLRPLVGIAGLETSPGFHAHADAHRDLHHLPLALVGFGLASVATLFAVHAIASRTIAQRGQHFGVTHIGDLAALPLLLALINLASMAAVPLADIGGRQLEHQADRLALERTHDNRACVSAVVGADQRSSLDTKPKWDMAQWWPSKARVDQCNDYRPWQPLHYYDIAVAIAEPSRAE